MNNNPYTDHDIIEHLKNNREFYIEFISGYTLQHNLVKQNINKLFHEDLDSQYRSMIIYSISNEVATRLALPVEYVIEILEEIDIYSYILGELCP